MKFLGTLLLVFSVWTSAAVAQYGYGNAGVSGYVTNVYNQPIGGMYMCMRGPLNAPVYPTLRCSWTNAFGFYDISFLFPGNYVISAQGYGVNYSQYIYLYGRLFLNFRF